MMSRPGSQLSQLLQQGPRQPLAKPRQLPSTTQLTRQLTPQQQMALQQQRRQQQQQQQQFNGNRLVGSGQVLGRVENKK